LFLSGQDFCFRGEALDFCLHDWHLDCGSYKRHQVSSPVVVLFWKSTFWSATVTKSPAKIIHVSLEFRRWHFWNQMLTNIIHVQMFVKNTANASN
jgi:hypothetical protein